MNRYLKLFLDYFIAVFSIAVFMSCAAPNPYEGISVSSNPDLPYYYFDNPNSESLLIYLEGSGYQSVLGEVNARGKWKNFTFSKNLVEEFSDQYSILIPEKLDFSMGHLYHNSENALLNSTVDAIGGSYAAKIDDFLQGKEYRKIILFGTSDGGALLPFVYNSLISKDKITNLAVFAGGGLSQLEELRILGHSTVSMPESYRELCLSVDRVLSDIQKDPNSIEKFYFGHPYRRWSSYFAYRPMDYLSGVEIPVLYIHGDLDWSTPVESTKAIEESDISDTIDFIYYPDIGHGESYQGIIRMINDVKKWLPLE